MSISFVTGKPGAGKGLYALQNIVDELVKGTRPIVTNLAIKMDPWLSGDGKPQAGLLAYLQRKFGQTFDAEKRVVLLTDEQCSEFYRWRYDRQRCELVELPITETSKGGACSAFDTTLASAHGGIFYVIDEVWKFFGARDWATTGKGALFYAAQHRKLGDDVLLVTQSSKQVDSGLRLLAQDFHQVRNHSLERIGIFRQPGVFTVSVFADIPTPSSEPQTRTVFKLDAPGLGGSYDTSAGVGIIGRTTADVGKRKKGLHWAWLLAGGVVAIVVLSQLPFLAGKVLAGGYMKGLGLAKSVGTNGAMGKLMPQAVPVPNNTDKPAVPVSELRPGPGSRLTAVRPDWFVPAEAAALPEPDEEWLTGYTKISGRLYIATNKRVYAPGDPAIELASAEFVVIRGKVFRWPDLLPGVPGAVGGASVAHQNVNPSNGPVRRVR